MYTLDTNAIIYYLKGDPRVGSIIKGIIANGTSLYVSTITEVELFAFSALSLQERDAIEQLLLTVMIISLDSRVAHVAGALRRQYGTKVPDSIIAATALVTHTILVTRNVKDFKNIPNISLKAI